MAALPAGCMNCLWQWLAVMAALIPTGAHHDGSAHRGRCPGRAHGFRGGVHRPDVPERVPAQVAVRRRSGRLCAPPARIADRLDGAAGARSPTGSPARCTGSPRPRASSGSTSPRANGRTTSCRSAWRASPRRRGWCSSVGRRRRTTVFRTEKRRHPDGVTYPWIVKTTGVVNQFYFYCVDADFGPFFLKFCSYFPYTGKALHQRTPLGAAAGREGGDRFHRDGQRVRRGRRPGRVAADLRPARPGADPGVVGQVAGDPAEPVHRAGHRRRLPVSTCRSCRPSSP